MVSSSRARDRETIRQARSKHPIRRPGGTDLGIGVFLSEGRQIELSPSEQYVGLASARGRVLRALPKIYLFGASEQSRGDRAASSKRSSVRIICKPVSFTASAVEIIGSPIETGGAVVALFAIQGNGTGGLDSTERNIV